MNHDVGRLPQVPMYRAWLTHSIDSNTTEQGPEMLVRSRSKGHNSQASGQGKTGASSVIDASAKFQPDGTEKSQHVRVLQSVHQLPIVTLIAA